MLFEKEIMSEELEEYILGHIDEEPEALARIDHDTHVQNYYWHMCSGHLQGRLIKMLTRMVAPRRVLELGTFSGYSALSMAEGLEDGAELHTFEIFDEQEDFIRKWFDGSKYANKLHLHIGDALELVPQMDVTWDLAFIDADKRQYVDYYRMVLPRMRKGGFIIADNTLWYGHVLEEHPRESDLQTQGVQAFNELVAKDDRVEKVILPLRDGLTLIRVKE